MIPGPLRIWILTRQHNLILHTPDYEGNGTRDGQSLAVSI